MSKLRGGELKISWGSLKREGRKTYLHIFHVFKNIKSFVFGP